jgi:hypothetical protein
MDDLTHAFQVLGLKPGASPEEVKQAYRDLVKVWHPDRFGHDERLRLIAQDKLKEINGASKVLEAHFFAAGSTPDTAPPDGAKPSAEASATNDAPPAKQNRMVLWAALGAIMVVLAVGLVLLLKRAAAPAQRPAATRYALSFDRDGSRVAIATTVSLSGVYTVECWALTRRPKGTETILSSRGPKDFSFDIKFREGKRFHGDIGDGSRWLARMANASFKYNPGIWYHIAYVMTPTNYHIYVNGEPWGSSSIYPEGNPMLYDSSHQLCLGADGIDQDSFGGCIAEVRVWKTARTAAEIKSNMNMSLTGSEPGLQGYWRFDEGSGSTTADSSGHGFSGTLIGGISWTTNTPPITH